MKNKYTLCLLAVLALCGCQTMELDDCKTISSESKTFSAIIKENLYDDTKTSLDSDGNVLWKKGDQVSIFAGSTINQHYQITDASDGKTSAALNPVSSPGFVAGSEIDNNVAFYPYSSTASIVKKSGEYEISGITLPSTQQYAAGSFGNGAFPMVAVTSSDADYNLKFKNILGCLKLQLKGTASIASISVKGNNNEILYGAAAVTASNGSIPSIELTDESSKTVTLDCGTGVQLNNSTATPFVIALPPMTMTGGFTVIVTDTEGKQMKIKTTKSKTITRSNILKMSEVTYEGEEAGTPLTFTSTGSTTIALEKTGTPYDITLEYRLNNGDWTAYTIGTSVSLNDKDKLAFQAGEGGNLKFSRGTDSSSQIDPDNYYSFKMSGTGTIAASGNIMSLVDQDIKSFIIPYENYFLRLFGGCNLLTQAPELPATVLANQCYDGMFSGCTSLTQAPKLPATTLASGCYTEMFAGCTSLTQAPELPATTLVESCYIYMFFSCTSLTTAPELPATTLASSCYSGMFRGCTSLTEAPELPATTLEAGCYGWMLAECTSLTQAPALPATTLSIACYNYMFYRCTSLTKAPELPATTLSLSCYGSMFSRCTSLTQAPELPATTLSLSCYGSMFSRCTSLTQAPELPATTLAKNCYGGMFDGCTSLTKAPELSVTTLVEGCYSHMFNGCTSLTQAPDLPATTLAKNCYGGMFSGCTSLTKAPELSVTTLVEGCYSNMFEDCTSLTQAPDLPATTLAKNCYGGMFSRCSKLNYVKALFTTTPSSYYTTYWLSGVSSTGTFVKNKDATWDVTGNHGIPEGWTVQSDPEAGGSEGIHERELY